MKTKHIITSIIAASLIFSFSGCTKSSSKSSSQVNAPSAQPVNTGKTAVKLKHINSETSQYLSGKTIAVILGHSYNDEETVSRLTQLLNLNYGVSTEEKPALITVLVYPDDFLVAGKVRVSSLYSTLEDKTLAGLITIGAPEGLCNAIARLEDKDESDESKGNKRTYPVFSLFPQDDILGSESTSDFVLDQVQKTTAETEQVDYIPYDVTSLLLSSVQGMINLRGPLPTDKNLMPYVQKLAGKAKKINRYFDNETGLVSVNHFIFE